jgi:hypothetical protein
MPTFQTPEQVFRVGNKITIHFSNSIGRITECNATIKNVLRAKENKLFLEFEPWIIPDQIHEGSELTLSFEGTDHKKHRFGSYVIEKKVGEGPLLILANPMAVDYTSFRRYIRADVDIACQCFFNGKSFENKVTNLSGCGLYALGLLNQEFKEGVNIKFDFKIPGNSKPTQLIGRVVRVEFVGNPVKQGIAVDFDEFVDEYTRMEIVVFVTRLLFEQGKLNPVK